MMERLVLEGFKDLAKAIVVVAILWGLLNEIKGNPLDSGMWSLQFWTAAWLLQVAAFFLKLKLVYSSSNKENVD